MQTENKIEQIIITEGKNSWVTRQLSKEEEILLADETIEAINKYIFDRYIYIVEQYDKLIAIYVLAVGQTKNEV